MLRSNEANSPIPYEPPSIAGLSAIFFMLGARRGEGMDAVAFLSGMDARQKTRSSREAQGTRPAHLE